ncbi:MAG: cytidylate kinase-like family protein [Geodermatophilaceae bacterium]|jgi:cytidylate kinase|nr:cytidylate kinase-like family protein [Geodermatophilaceae bacterium]
MTVVTLSATFGAGGSEIGPAVADALGLPFVDRAIPMRVAEKLGVSLADAQAKDETVSTGFTRLISSMALVPDLAAGAGPIAYNPVPDERIFREQTEKVLHEIAAGTGAVILGRAAALVLAGVPGALHVRLDAPAAARLEHIQREHGLAKAEAERLLRDNDAAREAYVKYFYRCKMTEARHYHLIIDSVRLPMKTVVAMIADAARAMGLVGRPSG